MKILKTKKSGYTTHLEIEESQEAIQVAMNLAFKKVAKSAKVPGFRPGKVTRTVFEKHYGQEPIIQEAVMDVVNKAYNKAVDELQLEVVDSPKNVDIGEYEKDKPIVFSCMVDVKPEVKLGKYKRIKVKKTPVDVTEEKVMENIHKSVDNHSQFVSVDRESQLNDILRFHCEAKHGDTVVDILSRQNMGLEVGKGMLGKEFDEQILGLKKEEKKSFDITFPGTYQQKEIAGKNLSFSIEIVDIQEKQLPELTDQLAAKVSDQKTVADLKESVKEKLLKSEQQESDTKLKQDIMDTIISGSKIDLPPAMIEREIDHLMNNLNSTLQRSGMTLDQYISITKKTESELRSDFEESAMNVSKSKLILEAIAKKEKMEVSESDMEAEIREWKIPDIETVSDLKNKMKQFNVDNLKMVLKERKAYDFLVSNAKIS
ncbi:MAG: trigger factor [Candidatus Margulisbacteria bacterium]|nr:trigger factor [Candidatus Margulisiibacteriota bacterium]